MMHATRQHQRNTADPTRWAKAKRGQGTRLHGLVNQLGNRGLQALRGRALQRKAEAEGVSVPEDPLEMLADRVADQVVAEPAAAVGPAPPPRGEPASGMAVQRDALPEADATHGDSMPGRPGPPAAARSPRPGGGPSPHGPMASELLSGLDAGTAMPSDVRRFMEGRFGRTFADVRVHTGDRAAEAAGSASAKAFTIGSEIVFGARRWAPETHEGKRLLAHELAHVVQQGKATGTPAPEAIAEADADRAGHDVTEGKSVDVSAHARPGSVQRQEEPEPTGRRNVPLTKSFLENRCTFYEGSGGVATVEGVSKADPVHATAWTNGVQGISDPTKTLLFVTISAPPGRRMYALQNQEWEVSVGPPATPVPIPEIPPPSPRRPAPGPKISPVPSRPLPEQVGVEEARNEKRAPSTPNERATAALSEGVAAALAVTADMTDQELAGLSVATRVALLEAAIADPEAARLQFEAIKRLVSTTPHVDAGLLEDQLNADGGKLRKKLEEMSPEEDKINLSFAMSSLSVRRPDAFHNFGSPQMDVDAWIKDIDRALKEQHAASQQQAYMRALARGSLDTIDQLANNIWTGGFDEGWILHELQQLVAMGMSEFAFDELKKRGLADKLESSVHGENNAMLHFVMSEMQRQGMGEGELASKRANDIDLLWDDTPGTPATFSVEKLPNDKYLVNMPARQVAGLLQSDRRGDARKLPQDLYLGRGIEVDADQLFTIHDYETGQDVELFASDLVGYQNRGIRTFGKRVAMTAAIPAGGAAFGARFVGGFVVGGAFNALEQGVQIYFEEGGRESLSFEEMIESGLITGLAAPVGLAYPKVALPAFTGMSAGNAGYQLYQGNPATAAFHGITGFLPYSGKMLPSRQTAQGWLLAGHLRWQAATGRFGHSVRMGSHPDLRVSVPSRPSLHAPEIPVSPELSLGSWASAHPIGKLAGLPQYNLPPIKVVRQPAASPAAPVQRVYSGGAGQVAPEVLALHLRQAREVVGQQRARMRHPVPQEGEQYSAAYMRERTKFYNALEHQAVLERMKLFPDRTIFEQVNIVEVRTADGRAFAPGKGQGRRLDIAEIHGNEVHMHELKTSSEIVRSAGKGSDVFGEVLPGSKFAKQLANESQLIDMAGPDGLLVFEGRHPLYPEIRIRFVARASDVRVSTLSDYSASFEN